MQMTFNKITHISKRLKPIFVALLGVATSVALVISLIPVDALAVTYAEKKAEAQAQLRTLEKLQAELDAVSDVYFGALEEKENAENKMAECQQGMEQATARIAQLQERLSTRAVTMYKQGTGSIIDVLLGASSFEEFATTWDLLNAINTSDANMVSEAKALHEQLETQKAEYEAAAQTAAEKAESVRSAYEQAASLEASARSTYNSLSSEAKILKEAEEAAAYLEAGGKYVDGAGSDLGSAVVAYAYSRLGCPYVWATAGPDTFDCSGLVYWCYRCAGVGLSRASSYYYANFSAVSDPQPGDVCVTIGGGHVGIYIGGGQMIHAPQTGDVVKISSVPSSMIIVRPY